MKATLDRCLAAAVVLAVILIVQGGNPPNHPTDTIENKYYVTGPWAVTVNMGGFSCDSLGNKFDLYYPTPLGQDDFKHPILTWGNRTNGSVSGVAYFLTHMASWGFVIIAAEDKNTGSGQTNLDAANYLVAANSNSPSPFFNKLNVGQIGAFGASQGATDAINALMKSNGSIKTVIPIELPSQVWCFLNCVDTESLMEGSVFFVDGSLDPISPPMQSAQTIGEQSIEAY